MKNVYLHLLGGSILGTTYLFLSFFEVSLLSIGTIIGWELNQGYSLYRKSGIVYIKKNIKRIILSAILDIFTGYLGVIIAISLITLISQ